MWDAIVWLWNLAPSLHPPIIIGLLIGAIFIYVKVSDWMNGGGGISVADGFHDTSKDSGDWKLWPRWKQKDYEYHEKKHEKKAKQFGADGYWFYTEKGAEFQRTNADHLTGVQHAAISLAPGSDCSPQDKENAAWYIRHYYPASEFRERMAEAKQLAK